MELIVRSFFLLMGVIVAIYLNSVIAIAQSVRYLVALGLYICFLGLSLVWSLFIYDLLGRIFLNRPALTAFQMSSLRLTDWLAAGLKQGLSYLFSLLIVEAIGIAFISQFTNFFFAFFPIVVIVLLVVFRYLFAMQYYCWLHRTVPLAESEWAAVGEIGGGRCSGYSRAV